MPHWSTQRHPNRIVLTLDGATDTGLVRLHADHASARGATRFVPYRLDVSVTGERVTVVAWPEVTGAPRRNVEAPMSIALSAGEMRELAVAVLALTDGRNLTAPPVRPSFVRPRPPSLGVGFDRPVESRRYWHYPPDGNTQNLCNACAAMVPQHEIEQIINGSNAYHELDDEYCDGCERIFR